MSKLSRRKGHQHERDIAIAFRKIFPEARRHLEYHSGDANGVDLINTGPYKIQCKRMRKHCSFSKIKEIQCDEFLGDVPVLISKADHERTLVAIPLEEFLRLVEIAYG